MVDYLLLKFAHVLGAVVMLGTGTGIAFFMLMAHRSGEPGFIARMARIVVIADAIFTASAVIVQPITGYLLVLATGRSLSEPWILLSLAFYLGAGLFWLPVVWFQMKLRDLAKAASENKAPLPDEYHRYFRLWFAFGFPGFGFTIAILWLMIAKPF
jgi:uncharacterized membrane protein